MIYVALLRGINVGGNNKIDMKQLKTVVERVGMRSVKTYINTGNIIFSDPDERTKEDIARLLENAIETHFALQIKVLIVSLHDMQRVMDTLPDTWKNDDAMKSDVLFLWEEYDRESVVEELGAKPGIDEIRYVPGAVLWSIDRKNATKSGLSKIIGTPLYRHVTIRNVNTTRKIFAMMQAAEQLN